MKKFVGIFVIFVFGLQVTLAQESTALAGNFKIYTAWIFFTEGSGLNSNDPFENLISKDLYQVNDSSLVLSSQSSPYLSLIIGTPKVISRSSYRKGKFQKQIYGIDVIDKIKVRRRGKVGEAVFLSMIPGALIGSLWARESYDENPNSGLCLPKKFCNKGTTTFSGAILGSLAGAIVGGILASGPIEILINGDLNKYKTQKEQLREYAILKY